MANGRDVLEFLLPEGGWVIVGDTFEGISFLECEPITKKQFQDGFSQVEQLLEQKRIQQELEKNQLLQKLGITEEEAKLLLS